MFSCFFCLCFSSPYLAFRCFQLGYQHGTPFQSLGIHLFLFCHLRSQNVRKLEIICYSLNPSLSYYSSYEPFCSWSYPCYRLSQCQFHHRHPYHFRILARQLVTRLHFLGLQKELFQLRFQPVDVERCLVHHHWILAWVLNFLDCHLSPQHFQGIGVLGWCC